MRTITRVKIVTTSPGLPGVVTQNSSYILKKSLFQLFCNLICIQIYRIQFESVILTAITIPSVSVRSAHTIRDTQTPPTHLCIWETASEKYHETYRTCTIKENRKEQSENLPWVSAGSSESKTLVSWYPCFFLLLVLWCAFIKANISPLTYLHIVRLFINDARANYQRPSLCMSMDQLIIVLLILSYKSP